MILHTLGELTDQNFTKMSEQSTVLERLRLPTRLGGCGITSVAKIGPIMYMASLLKTIPNMADQTRGKHKRQGFCPHGAEFLLGHPGPCTNMTDFIDGGSDKGKEFKTAHTKCLLVVDSPDTGIWSEPYGTWAEMIGPNKPQKRLTSKFNDTLKEQLDNRFKSIKLQSHSAGLLQQKRAYMSAQPCTNGRMPGCKPSKENGAIPNTEFVTMWAIYLGLPLPCLRWINTQNPLKVKCWDKKTKKHVLKESDVFGNVLSSTATGSWRIGHDVLKHQLFQFGRSAGAEIYVEPLNLFSRLISNSKANATATSGRQRWFNKHGQYRQGCVPDLLLQDGCNETIYDVKTMSNCKTHYAASNPKMNSKLGAALTKEKSVPGQCLAKAREVDKNFNDTPKGVDGPVTKRMKEYPGGTKGLVFGAFGESSPNVGKFLKLMASKLADKKWRTSGFKNKTEAQGVLMHWMQTTMGVEALRVSAQLVLRALAIASDKYSGTRNPTAMYAYHKWSELRDARALSNQYKSGKGTQTFSHHNIHLRND